MAIMISKKVDMFSPKNIAVIATIMVIGIGGSTPSAGTSRSSAERALHRRRRHLRHRAQPHPEHRREKTKALQE
jgi:hypothetical protein